MGTWDKGRSIQRTYSFHASFPPRLCPFMECWWEFTWLGPPLFSILLTLGFPAEFRHAKITRNRSVMDFIITCKKLFITRNYVLRIIASFKNKTKRNVITRNCQLNETGETNIQKVFSTFKSLFSSRVSAEFRYAWITRNRSLKNCVITRKKLIIMWNYVLCIIVIFGNET